MSHHDQFDHELMDEISDRISNGMLMLQKTMSLMNLGVSDEEAVESFDQNNEAIDQLVQKLQSSELLEIALEKVRNYKRQVIESTQALSSI